MVLLFLCVKYLVTISISPFLIIATHEFVVPKSIPIIGSFSIFDDDEFLVIDWLEFFESIFNVLFYKTLNI